MRRYELMVLLDPDVEERTVGPSLEQYLGVVRQDGGTVEKVDIWGRRRLAYEIDKKAEASTRSSTWSPSRRPSKSSIASST
jgi:small subunit ribosomal protein S6